MSRVRRKMGTKASWRKGESKQYGVQAHLNFANKSNAASTKTYSDGSKRK